MIIRDTDLKEKERKIRGLEMVLPFLPSSVQVNGEGKKIATTGQIAFIELSASSLQLNLLSCQLTDPNSQHVECSITSTQPGMATVSYTPTLRGAHQLKIIVGDTDIPGSPFTVHVLPSLEMRGWSINTITGVRNPRSVAISKGGEVVVSDWFGHCSLFSKEGKKIREFGCKGSASCLCGVSITTDNYILVADRNTHKIKMFTMEGEIVRSVGEYGNGPLQFNNPSGIAVHPSGLVFVVDEYNHRIQVLYPDLSFSHMFGSQGSGPGQFNVPIDVACDSSSGIVYVTDYDNHCVQSFSADGQFIFSFGSEGAKAKHGHFYRPHGICIDSTDSIVYVTDRKNHVSAFNLRGQFLKCFGKHRKYKGIAVDNTTGNIYVCDSANHRVVIY